MSHREAVADVSPLAPSGFTELDQLSGGLVPGRMWVVLGRPGEGKTTLLTQWAIALALNSVPVQLVCPREPADRVAARLLSIAGRIPLAGLTYDRTHYGPADRLSSAREQIAKLPLWAFSAEERAFIPETDPEELPTTSALVIDDADLVSGLTIDRVCEFASRGLLVVVSLPRHLVAQREGDEPSLAPGWARAADVIIDVRHTSLPTGPDQLRPGEADLVLLKNRWGPLRTFEVLFQAHYSRFVDLAQAQGTEGNSNGETHDETR
jgi:replicative DNA helicase